MAIIGSNNPTPIIRRIIKSPNPPKIPACIIESSYYNLRSKILKLWKHLLHVLLKARLNIAEFPGS